jgi:hypothetical protein
MVQVEPDDEEENVTRHSATDAEKCEEMEERYNWELKRVERNTSNI